MRKYKKLVISPHIDDEVLGCAGTVAKLVKSNHNVHLLIMAEGITSRKAKKESDIKKMKTLYTPLISKGAKFFTTSRKGAELIKYASNSFLATSYPFR